jgi:release factor glutamine methyltransferase
MTTIQQSLIQTESRLSNSGVESARLDCLLLLGHVIGKSKAQILAHPELELKQEQVQKLDKLVSIRAQHVPMAYILGRQEFYGREFIVNNSVLVPRPESEAIITLLKIVYKDSPCTVIDVGCGSGALAISAKIELPETNVIGLDIDPACLEISRQNAKQLGVDIKFIQSDLLEVCLKGLLAQPTIILANLPYVPIGYPINKATKHEPDLALYSGKDGLDHYRKMFSQLSEIHDVELSVITESLLDQHHALAAVAKQHRFVVQNTDGLAQLFTFKGNS